VSGPGEVPVDVGAERSSWASLAAEASRRLGNPREARWLVEEASGAAWPSCAEELAGERAARHLESMLVRREAGEPLQYVLGRWGFRRLDLLVDRRVLIPRPETEQVVEVALGELRRRRQGAKRPVVVDLGTGSGAIALALALEADPEQVWATDVSAEAIEVARANAAGTGRAATKVSFAEGDWWAALPAHLQGQVDLAVSNPPYVSSAEVAALEPVVAAWEPRLALEAGPTGLEAVAAVVGEAPVWLAPTGVLVVEIAPHQAADAGRLALAAGLGCWRVEQDLAGRPRCLVASAGGWGPSGADGRRGAGGGAGR